MACALTSGYTLGCREEVGGLEAVWIIPHGDVSSVAEVSGLVTGITKATAKQFYKFEIPRAVANATHTLTGSEENGTIFYTHSVVLPLNKRDSTTANIIRVLAKNKLMIVSKDMSGRYHLYGKRFGLYLNSNEAGSGTAPGDRNGYLLTFTGAETDDAVEVNSTAAGTLETPGS